MDQRHVPILGLRYWVALCAASVFGANMGDYFAHDLGLGHLGGLPILALALAGTLIGARFDQAPREIYYWAAIVVIRTAATNSADLANFDLGLPSSWLIAGLALALATTIFASNSMQRLSMKGQTLRADTGYWISMFFAGTLGTVIGDFFSSDLNLGDAKSSLILGTALAFLFLEGWRGMLSAIPFYWLTVVWIRAAGTVIGDYFAGDDLLGLGTSTLITGASFVLIIWLWRDPIGSKTPRRFQRAEGTEQKS
jgi:uncharacterized membrane-anchored protein